MSAPQHPRIRIPRLLFVSALIAALSIGPVYAGDAPSIQGLPASRTFFMSVTPWPYDFTSQGINDAYAFIDKYTDFNVHHFDDGIPWPEALEQKEYHANVERDLRARVARLRKDRKTYVAVTPAREEGIVGYWAAESSMPLPDYWKKKAIDDPEVFRAYLAFCRDLIRRFHPDFMAYGIEVNMIAKDRARWARFVRLARAVYTTLKAEHPTLPLFVSLQVDVFWQDPQNQRKAIAQILPYTDYIAVSAYPYFTGHHDPKLLPRGFFADVAALAPDKPYTVAETGFIAIDMEAFGRKVVGREDWQRDYLSFVLTESNRLHAEFVVWFVSRDYDALWDRVKFLGGDVEVFKVFKNTGLLDGSGRTRPAMETWRQWLTLPRR